MRKVKVEDTARPRDAELRRARDLQIGDRRGASNDNAANDNNPSYPTVSDQFNASYASQGLQPSVGGMMTYRNVKAEPWSTERSDALRRTGSTVKIAGRGAQATGYALKGTSVALRSAGSVTMRVGAALSGTGVGAIVGVPLVAVGATLTGAGVASRGAGQISSQSGKRAVRFGGVLKRAGIKTRHIDDVLKNKRRREIFSNITKLSDEEDEKLIISDVPKIPPFPFLIVLMAVFKDVIDFLLNLTLIAAPLPVISSFLVGVVLFFWVLGKASGGWWKKRLIKWLWTRYVITLLIELVPFVNIVPATTIFILMAHYREKKIVRIINGVLEELRKLGLADIKR